MDELKVQITVIQAFHRLKDRAVAHDRGRGRKPVGITRLEFFRKCKGDSGSGKLLLPAERDGLLRIVAVSAIDGAAEGCRIGRAVLRYLEDDIICVVRCSAYAYGPFPSPAVGNLPVSTSGLRPDRHAVNPGGPVLNAVNAGVCQGAEPQLFLYLLRLHAPGNQDGDRCLHRGSPNLYVDPGPGASGIAQAPVLHHKCHVP